jgi:serine/threonine protein kinase
VAPEILKNIPHDESVDMWSAGVVLFVLLVGYTPFVDENQATMFAKIRTGDWIFYEEDWRHISKEARDLIEGLLVVDPKHRWTAKEALRCEWITQDDQLLRSRDLSQSLQQIRERRARLRGLAKAVMWLNNNKDGADPVFAATKVNDLGHHDTDASSEGWKIGSSHRDIC